MTVLLFTTDLACSSRVTGEGNARGVPVAVAMSAGALLEKSAGCRLVLLDLNSPGVDPSELVPALSAHDPVPTIIAFAPHVHETKLQSATIAGCHQVLTRGQFHSQVGEILQKYG